MSNLTASGNQCAASMQDNVQLEQAFQLFNQFSEKLAGSYADLECHVTRLTTELAEARSERLKQLAEKELLASRLEGLLDVLPAGIVVLNEDDCIIQTNPIACLMLAKPEKNLIGASWKNIAQYSLINKDNELRLRDKRWVNVLIRPLSNENGNAVMGKLILISDITETRLLQNKLNQQQRLSSLGEMIAGLAHQIRTPLSSALLYITTINHPLNDKKERVEFADKARERLLHLERMVSEMLLFAKGDVVKSEYINCYEFMCQLKNTFESDEKIERRTIAVDESLKYFIIQANFDVVLSAVQNIIDNAIDACMDCVNDELSRVDIEAILNEKNQFEIKITDNGCGISQEIKEKILQPFFTTKSTGTGLGLAVVNTAVNRYSGVMKIESEVGVGSCFTIVFPRSEVSGLLPSDAIRRNSVTNISALPITEKVMVMNEKDEICEVVL
jgi:two-component system sensor histidine kinase FlrB